MAPLITLIDIAFTVYIYIIIAQVALSWLISFEIINAENPQAQNLIELLKKLTDPVYAPLRKFIPAIGGIDITPIIVIIGLGLIKGMLISIFIGFGV